MEKFLKKVYEKDIENILMVLEKDNQLCVCGTDPQIVEIVLKSVSLFYRKRKYKILNLNKEEEISKGDPSLVLMDLGGCTGLNSTKLLYFYLEQTHSPGTKVLLSLTDCSSLDSLVRRVKSRFKDNVHVLRNLTLEEYLLLSSYLKGEHKEDKKGCKKGDKYNKKEDKYNKKDKGEYKHTLPSTLEKQFKVSPSLSKLLMILFKDKYKVEDYSDKRMLHTLNTVHLSLLILSLRVKLDYKNVVREFKRFRCKELKNVKDEETVFYFYDLLDFGLINEKGVFLYSEMEFKNFILGNSPMYLKRLLRGVYK